jgi:hypothetical protein
MSQTYELLSQQSVHAPTMGPDLVERMNADHERIAYLIEQLLDINLQAVQQRIFEDLKTELRLHFAVYDQVFAPAFIHGVDEAANTRLQAQISDFLTQLSTEGMTSPKWMLIFGEMKHAIEQYIDDHNVRLFPQARQMMPQEALEALSAQAEAVRHEYAQRYGLSSDHVDKA